MKINKVLITSVLIFILLPLMAQNNTNSPYTRFGYGDLGERSFGAGRAMGGVGYGLRSPKQINPMNPASYSCMDSLTFLFDFGVPQSRKRVYIVGFHREKCSGKVLSFTDANPKTLVKRISGREGNRVYSADGLSITLTSQAGGFGGKTGLYEIIGLPIKSKTKSGYQIALPGDSIDLAYPNMNSRRGRVGKEIAHTLTTSCNQGYYALGIDMNPEPKVTELARCITARQDSGIGHHKGEKSGVVLITDPIAVLDPAKAETRQQGRRFKLPNEPMFTITVTDRHGVVYCGYIRKLMPLECWRLQGFTDEQFERVKATGMSDAQLYKQAGNAVTTNVVEAVARIILETEKGENA